MCISVNDIPAFTSWFCRCCWLLPPQGPEPNAGLLPEASENKKGIQRSGRFFRVRIAEKKSDMVRMMMTMMMQTRYNEGSLHPMYSFADAHRVMKTRRGAGGLMGCAERFVAGQA